MFLVQSDCVSGAVATHVSVGGPSLVFLGQSRADHRDGLLTHADADACVVCVLKQTIEIGDHPAGFHSGHRKVAVRTLNVDAKAAGARSWGRFIFGRCVFRGSEPFWLFFLSVQQEPRTASGTN